MPADVVRSSVFIAAPPERVYRYFVEPQALVRWMGDYAELDPRPQGRFAVDIRGVPVRGRFLECEPPHRLVLAWGYAGSAELPPGTSTVEIRLHPQDGGTRVELEHRDLPASTQRGHDVGWGHYLPRLQAACETGSAGADPGMPDSQDSSLRGPGH